MKVSIVIPTYNRKDLLRRCLTAVLGQEYADYEVIVIDDGSTDGTEEVVREAFPQVRYLRQGSNRGPAAARNRGIREATGEIVVFTDDDCVPPQDWLRAHLRYFDDPSLGAAGGPQVPRSPSFYDEFEMAHSAAEYREVQRRERISGWEGLPTCSMSVRREVFECVGLFDERFPTAAGEDAEFARRACRAGYVLMHDPALQVEHLRVHTFRSYMKMRFRRGCGSVLVDIKEGTLSVRRFVPLVNVVGAWRDWGNFRAMFGGGLNTFTCFWMLVVIMRLVDVAARAYYYWKVGRFYHTLRAA